MINYQDQLLQMVDHIKASVTELRQNEQTKKWTAKLALADP